MLSKNSEAPTTCNSQGLDLSATLSESTDMKSIANNQLIFHNTKFNAAQSGGQVWLTSSELAQALEYSSTKSVTNLYNQNSDEFTPAMTQVIEMMTIGINNNLRKKRARVFSLRGAHLLGMFANTTVAKQFRKWALDVLDNEVEECKSESLLLRHYDCRVLYTFDSNGTIVSAQQAREGEHLASAKAFAEVMSKRGYVLVKAEDFKSVTFHH